MPQDIFSTLAAQPTLFGGTSQTYTPDFNVMGLPGMQGPQGMLLQLALGPLLQGLLGPGVMPFQFAPQQNFYDATRSRQMFMAQQQAMRMGAEADKGQQVQFLRGLADAAGVKWTQERQASAEKLTSTMAPFMPILASMFPETYDQVHGIRGSANVMAQQFFMGARYAVDPVNGRMMMSGDSAGTINRMLYDQMYGPGVNLAPTKGLGAGQMGALYRELQTRGAMGTDYTAEETQRLGGALGASGGLGGALGGPLAAAFGAGPGSELGLRGGQASRIKERLEAMAGSVAAMKDIFGEMGDPNAPMPKLISALNALTEGGLASMNPQQLERTIRTLAVTARSTGMSMDSMGMLLSTTARAGDAFGLSRELAPEAAKSGAIFGRTYGNMTGGVPFFGKMDAEKAAVLGAQLSAQAQASEVANQLAATRRIGKEFGFTAGTEAAAIADAIAKGKTTYDFGGRANQTIYVDPGRWQEIVRAGAKGLTAGQAALYLGAQADNQRFMVEANIGGLTRQLQGRTDVAPMLAKAYAEVFGASGNANIKTRAGLLGEITAQTLLSMDPKQVQDQAAVAAAVAANPALKGAGFTPDDLKMLGINMGLGYAGVAEVIRREPQRWGGFGPFPVNLILSFNERMLAEEQRRRAENIAEADIQGALGSLGRASPLARLFDVFAGGNVPFAEAARQVLNYVPAADVQSKLEDLKKAYRAYGDARTPEEKAALLDKIRELSKQAAAVGGGLTTGRADQTPEQVVQSLFTALGAPPGTVTDPGGSLAGMVEGPRGERIRDALAALEELRGTAAGRGLDAADYFGKVAPEDLTQQEIDLLSKAGPLVGIDPQDTESIGNALRRYSDKPLPAQTADVGGTLFPPGTQVTFNITADKLTISGDGNLNPKPVIG